MAGGAVGSSRRALRKGLNDRGDVTPPTCLSACEMMSIHLGNRRGSRVRSRAQTDQCQNEQAQRRHRNQG